jgi:hypothetical protein
VLVSGADPPAAGPGFLPAVLLPPVLFRFRIQSFGFRHEFLGFLLSPESCLHVISNRVERLGCYLQCLPYETLPFAAVPFS